MTDFCYALEHYNIMTEEEKKNFLTDIVNNYLQDLGYLPVAVTFIPEEEYNVIGSQNIEGINIDPTIVNTFPDSVQTALHEAQHETQMHEQPDLYDEYSPETGDISGLIKEELEADADKSALDCYNQMVEDCIQEESELPPGDLPPDLPLQNLPEGPGDFPTIVSDQAIV